MKTASPPVVRAVCYARVSSIVQRDRDTIASQIRVLPEFVERQGWKLVAPVGTYVDDGKSAKAGKLEKRTGLAALLRDAALRKFDIVCVVDLDRITRSEDLTERGAILGAFQTAGVKIASANTGQVLDFSTSMGDLFGTLQSFFAAEENRKRSERIKAGKITAAGRGRKPSGPTPYGYSYDRATGAWSIDREAAPIVREIFKRVAAGESSVAIADDLMDRGVPRPRSGQWTRYRVWQLARATTYLGEWVADKDRDLRMPVPAIIDQELFDAAQASLKAHNRRGLRRTRHVYLLEGLMTCGECGAAVHIRSATKQRRGLVSAPAYVCKNRKLAHRGILRCDAKIAHVSAIDSLVWGVVASELADPALPARVTEAINRRRGGAARDWAADAAEWRRKLKRLDEHETMVLARARRGHIGEAAMDVELVAIRRERAALVTQLNTAAKAEAADQTKAVRADAVAAALRDLAASAANASPDEKRTIVALLVQPGSAVLKRGELSLSLALPSAALTDRELRLAMEVAYRIHHESKLRLQVVTTPKRSRKFG